jgi:hypothetical protein
MPLSVPEDFTAACSLGVFWTPPTDSNSTELTSNFYGFALSYAANTVILMILYDLCLFPAQFVI